MAKAAGPSSPALQRRETLPVRSITVHSPGLDCGPEEGHTLPSEAAVDPGSESSGRGVRGTMVKG